MTYSVEKLPDEPIVISTISASFSMDQYEQFLDDLTELLDMQTEPVYHVTVVNKHSFSFQEVLVSTNRSSRGPNPILHHPNLAGMVTVTTNKIIRLASKGLNSEIFGNIHIDLFETMDEALDFVRSRVTA